MNYFEMLEQLQYSLLSDHYTEEEILEIERLLQFLMKIIEHKKDYIKLSQLFFEGGENE